MNRKGFFINMTHVLFSRIVTLLSSLATGFLVPKLLGVTDYGYLKLYSLYTVYTALLHMGFVDGILLKFAGLDYDSLDQEQMRTCSTFFLLFQGGLCLLFGVAGLFVTNSNNRFIVTALGVNLFLNNVTTYYQFVSQATQRFREYSFRSVAAALLKTSLVLGMLAANRILNTGCSFQRYILLLNGIDAGLLGWYLFTYRQITFGPRRRFSACGPLIKELFQQGILLTLAYQAAHLVFALDRQFVSILFSTAVYGVYSFAYSIVHMISQLISSVSTVLFPTLKKQGAGAATRYYSTALAAVSVISGGALAGYFPLAQFIRWYLPDYDSALSYLRIIWPSLMLTCCISVVMFTFYKIIGKNGIYLKSSCFALTVGIALNMGCYSLFHTPESISWASVITMICWYFAAGLHFSRKNLREHIVRLFYIMLLGAAFYLIARSGMAWWTNMALYLIAYCMITAAMHGKSMAQCITRL